jgi:hypothetical protein
VFNIIVWCIGFFQVLTLGVIFSKTYTSKRLWVAIAPLPFLTGALWFFTYRFVAPKAFYATISAESNDNGVDSDNIITSNYNGAPYGRVTSPTGSVGGEQHHLEEEAFNPSLVKPLMKLWVPKQSKHLLEHLYIPRYESFEDYIMKNPQVRAQYQKAGKNRRLWGLGNGMSAAMDAFKKKKKQDEKAILKARFEATAALGAGVKDSDADFDEHQPPAVTMVAHSRIELTPMGPDGRVMNGAVIAADDDDLVPPEELQEQLEDARRQSQMAHNYQYQQYQ